MSSNGGYRPGAGRKKGSKGKKTIEQEIALDFLREKIRVHFEDLLTAKMDLALGHYELVKETDSKGRVTKVRAYRKSPDGIALEYLLSVVIGRPKESLDLQTKITDNLSPAEKKALDKIKKMHKIKEKPNKKKS